MWERLKEAFEWLADTLSGWLLDLLVWVIEFLYSMCNDFLSWLFGFEGDMLEKALEKVAGHIPDNLIENILSAYGWLEYINNYVPVKLAITLFIAYFAMYVVISTYRLIRSLIPFT